MVIVKNPKTGKYEIKESPPEFYQSPSESSSSSSKKAVYIPIEDITTTPTESGGQDITIEEGAAVYERSSGGSSSFVQTGTIESGGIVDTPTQTDSTKTVEQQAVSSFENITEAAQPKTTAIQYTQTGTPYQILTTGEKVYYDPQTGQPTAIEADIGYGKQSMAIEEYEKEIERRKEVKPQEKYVDPKTGELFEEKQTVQIGEYEATSTPFKVYVDPKTQEPIKNIGQYLKEQDIPFTYTVDKKIKSPQEFFEKITETKTYDIETLEPIAYKSETGYAVGKEFLFSQAALEGGGAIPVTPLDITALVAPAIKGGFLVKQAFSSGAVDILLGADVISYATGVSPKIKAGTYQVAGSLLEFGERSKIPLAKPASVVGATVFQTLGKLPAQTPQELVADIAIGGVVGKAFIGGSRLAKGVVGTGLLAYSGYQISSAEDLGDIGLGVLATAGGALLVRKEVAGQVSKLLEGYTRTKTDITGVKYAEIDLSKQKFDLSKGELEIKQDILKLEFIPARSATEKADVNILDIVQEGLPYKDKPKLPKTTPEQKKIIEVVKEKGDVISGSFAQQALIKDSRQFKDLDIISYKQQETASRIIEELGEDYAIKKQPTALTVTEIETGKELADIVPYKVGEMGYSTVTKPIEVEGLKLVAPEARLASKIQQSLKPLPTKKRVKVAGDIAQLLGYKGTPISQLRGYGLSKAEQKAALLEGDFFAVHGGQDLLPRFGKEITLGGKKVGSPELFFSTPSPVKQKELFARASRMGIGTKVKRATILDILKGERITILGKRKQILIETGKLGDEFIQPNIGTSEIEVARILPKEGVKLKKVKKFRTFAYGEPIEIVFAEPLKTKKIIDSKLLQKELSKKVQKGIYEQRTSQEEIKQLVIEPKARGIMEENIRKRTQEDFRIDIKQRRSQIIRKLDIPTRIEEQPRRRKKKRTLDTPRRIDATRLDMPVRSIPRGITPKLSIRLDLDLQKRDYGIKKKEVELYSVEVKRKGKFKKVRGDLTYGEALTLGTGITKETLARTFKVRRTGKKEILGLNEDMTTPDLEIFREYKIQRGAKRQLPRGTFIQKREFGLATIGEKREIQKARKEAMQLNKLINM